MSELIKDFKINTLIEEYHKYSSYFYNFQNHIEKCYSNNIINIRDRNNYLKQINDLIRQLNSTYNVAMVETCENESEVDKKMTFNDRNVNEVRNLMHIHKVIGIENFNDPFRDITNQLIIKFGSKIGFPTIQNALSIIIDDQYKYLYDNDTNNLISFYNNIFIPIKYNIEKISENKMNSDKTIFIKKIDLEHLVLLNNCANIYIKYNDSYICLSGYFLTDSLNIIIRTSQLCNNFIYQKKKDLEVVILSKKEIHEKFVKSYLRNISVCDVLTLSNDEFIDKMKEEYKLYNKLVKLSFIHLMKEFVKDETNQKLCVLNMFNIQFIFFFHFINEFIIR